MERFGRLAMVSSEMAEQLIDDATGILAFLAADVASPAELDLGETWHGLHFLFTGTAWDGEPPLGFLVVGGQEVGVDLGAGLARIFGIEQVKAIAAALASYSVEDLRRAFDPEKFAAAGISPEVWDEPYQELRDQYAAALEDLKDFVQRAAAAERSLVVAFI